MRQRGVGLVQIICAAEVLEPSIVIAVLKPCILAVSTNVKICQLAPYRIPNRILNSLLNFTSWSTDSSLHQATSSFPRRHGVFLR